MTARLHRGAQRFFQRFFLAGAPVIVAGALIVGAAPAQAAANAKTQKSTTKTAAGKSSKAGKARTKQPPPRGIIKQTAKGRVQVGSASWYGPGFHGRKTANGERFDMYALTAAHRTLPLGTRVVVRNPANGKEVVVRINDRGPYAAGRILDLSKAAASQLGLISRGHGEVEVQALGPDGAGLSSKKLARASDGDDTRQAELLAKTKFGDSNHELGSTVPPSEGDEWRPAPVAVGPPLGLSADVRSVVDAPRMGLNWSPWLRLDWGMQRLASNAHEQSQSAATPARTADQQTELHHDQVEQGPTVTEGETVPGAD